MITATRKQQVIEFSDGKAICAVVAIPVVLKSDALPRALAMSFVNYYLPRDFEPPAEDISVEALEKLQSHVRAWSARAEALHSRFEEEVREALRGLNA